jgi:hypothetical protein
MKKLVISNKQEGMGEWENGRRGRCFVVDIIVFEFASSPRDEVA